MLLSDRDIRAAIGEGKFRIDPFEDRHVQPASVDVTLGDEFRVLDNHQAAFIDPQRDQAHLYRPVEVKPGQCFVLHPGEFVLGCTGETFELPGDLAARVEGKSSLGRLGLLTHSTAGWVDPGFRGQLTLELANVATLPVKLWPGMRIGQLCLFRCSSPAQFPYGSGELGSRYQGQWGPTPSRSHVDWSPL